MYNKLSNSAVAARTVIVAFAVLLVLAACTCRDPQEDTAPAETQPQQTHAHEGAAVQPEQVSASMRVVTRDGRPLPGMIPIATLTPNAFDTPVASGPPTNMSGESHIQFPADKKVTLRAWDQNLLYFPNNFFEVLPNTGAVRETLVVGMVESAAIEAILITPDGEPAQNENVGVMLFHPVHGPWWPAEGNTDENGAVTFYRVPPGQYVLRLKLASGPTTDVPETYIPPGESAHIGRVYFE